jgi:ATP-dependent DNA ligase
MWRREPCACASLAKTASLRHITPDATEEIKLDGYRAVGIKSDRSVRLLSRRNKSFNHQYPHIVEAIGEFPENTVVDGEVVALDESGRPNFNLLQNYRSEASRIHYFVFDLLIYKNRDLTRLPLMERRKIMRSALNFNSSRIWISDYVEASAPDMLHAVREQRLEGIIGKRRDSVYEPGKRSGAWIKYRVNRGQELVIGGYIPGSHGLDSMIVGYYKEDNLIYVARGKFPCLRSLPFLLRSFSRIVCLGLRARPDRSIDPER